MRGQDIYPNCGSMRRQSTSEKLKGKLIKLSLLFSTITRKDHPKNLQAHPPAARPFNQAYILIHNALPIPQKKIPAKVL